MTREEAIKFWKFRYENAKDYTDPHWEAQERREHREYVEALRKAVEALSAAEPKTGEWVKIIDEETPNLTKWHYECDQCGAGRWEEGQRYCQNCGARMIREDGEA